MSMIAETARRMNSRPAKGELPVNLFIGTRISIVEEGHILWNHGRPWKVESDRPVVIGDTTYSTEEGYQDTLKTLAYLGHVGSRYDA